MEEREKSEVQQPVFVFTAVCKDVKKRKKIRTTEYKLQQFVFVFMLIVKM
jgi:hypothetical protein